MLIVVVVVEEKGCLGLMCTPSSSPSRVQFRADLLEQRRMEREARELEQQREEQERENRLQALRNQVDHYLLLTLSATRICSVS